MHPDSYMASGHRDSVHAAHQRLIWQQQQQQPLSGLPFSVADCGTETHPAQQHGLSRSMSLQLVPTSVTAVPSGSLQSPPYRLDVADLTGAPVLDPALALPRKNRSKSTLGHVLPVTASFVPMQRLHASLTVSSTRGPMLRAMSNQVHSQQNQSTPMRPIAPMPPANRNAFGITQATGMPVFRELRQGRQSDLANLQEEMSTPNIGEDVASFLARHALSQEPVWTSDFMPLSPPMAAMSYSPQTPSSCPSMVSGASVAEGVSMSRANSSYSTIFPDAFEMDRIDSACSQYAVQQTTLQKREELFTGVGASLSDPNLSREQELCLDELNSNLYSMDRSVSSASLQASSYLDQRAKEATQRYIISAKTELRPKQSYPSPTSSPQSTASPLSSQIAGMTAARGHPPAAVTVITKSTNRQRLRPTKVMCTECDEHSDGFRGEHELRRHMASKHMPQVKRWVCRDPRDLGIDTKLKPIKELSKCKHCVEGKSYNIDYNAAAHLRRIHFNPKSMRAAKNKPKRGVAAIVEKRGGKGGGDLPDILELRHWLVELTVDVQHEAGQVENGDADDIKMDVHVSSQHTAAEALGVGGSALGFDLTSGAALVDLTPNFDYLNHGANETLIFGLSSDFELGLMPSMSDSIGSLVSATSSTSTITPANFSTAMN